jgi:hypothetical protein
MKIRQVSRVRKDSASLVVSITKACRILNIQEGDYVHITVEKGPSYDIDTESDMYNKGLEIFG